MNSKKASSFPQLAKEKQPIFENTSGNFEERQTEIWAPSAAAETKKTETKADNKAETKASESDTKESEAETKESEAEIKDTETE